ncbi:hypothetical protein [Mycolicibacterium goodii]|uniref:hypothetical protein n=1 Tax=Mycolicibacterium goodii TaxID=134601 RepID=UPI00257C3C15|nr:hypothetical protein [Mycolicibacterium goodii]
MIDNEQRARIFSAAASDIGDGHARIRLFRALGGVTLYYVATEQEIDGTRVLSTRVRRLDDGSSAMVVYTSRRHPDLPDRFVASQWSNILKAAYEIVRPDWLVVANVRNETVAIARDQIPVILADLSVPVDDRMPNPVVVADDLENLISNAVRTAPDDWYESAIVQLRGRELFLHLNDGANAGQLSMVTSSAAGRAGWLLSYTSRTRPGIRYGGITWDALADVIKNNPETPGVRVVNEADDWILLGRDAFLRLSTSTSPEDNMTGTNIDVSEALTLYLKHYPGKDDTEFDTFYGTQTAPIARERVRALLDEAISLRPDWSHMTLNDAGDFVEAEMRARHPDLSPKALECIGNTTRT